MMACLTPEQIELLIRNAVPPTEAEELRRHGTQCPTCRGRLEESRANEELLHKLRTIPLRGLRHETDSTASHYSFLFPGYEIIRELSRGGQGAVYQAVQLSTKRKVAIKVLLEGPYASESSRKRFEREIELVASLRHPNIITIHQSGRTDDGHPFYVMDYVPGRPLNQYLSDTKSALREVLGLFVTICDAVTCAHQHGVIHRDLKPSNILVDDDGVPRILDFGLAKSVGGPEHTLVSQAGQVVGTLPYISPEQARGNSDGIDTRTDVYSLGVILYEILTGQYPYPVTGPMADVLKNIADSAPIPPNKAWKPDSGVVERNRRKHVFKTGCPIDDEVQTVVLKALAKEPDRRYQSVNDLARDIRHYLAGEPIEAKRDSGLYVLRKKLLQYKAAVAVALAFLVIISAALVVSLWQWQVAKNNARIAQTHADAAARNLQKARDAVDQMLTEVGQNSLANVPQMEPLRKSLLEKAVTFYQGFIQENSDDPAVRLEIARAYNRLGEIAASLGQLEASETAHRQSITLLENLVARFPAVAEYRWSLARSHISLGYLCSELLRRPPEAMSERRKAVELDEQLVAEFPNVPEYRGDLGASCRSLAMSLQTDGRLEEAEKEFRRSLALQESISTGSDDDFRLVTPCHESLGSVLAGMGRFAEAEEYLRKALEGSEKLHSNSPDQVDYRKKMRQIRIMLGAQLNRAGRYDEGEGVLRQAEVLGKALLADFPDTFSSYGKLGLSYMHLGTGLLGAGRYRQAEEALRNRLRLQEEMMARFPEAAKDTTGLAWAHYDLGLLMHLTGRSDKAAEYLRKAVAGFEEHLVRSPDDLRVRKYLAWVLTSCPDLRFRNGPRAVAVAEDGLRRAPESLETRQILGMAYYRTGRWTEAIDTLTKGKQETETLFFLAMACWQSGDRSQARQWYDRAVQDMETNAPGDVNNRILRAEAAALLNLTTQPAEPEPPTSLPTLPPNKQEPAN